MEEMNDENIEKNNNHNYDEHWEDLERKKHPFL